MHKLTCAIIGVAFAAAMASPAMAQNSKAAGATSSLTVYFEGDSWGDVNGMSLDIRVPQQEDLTFDVALQCSLATTTEVKSKGSRATATAEAGVKVRVRIEELDGNGDVVDGTTQYASPSADIGAEVENSGVTYCWRSQTLEALLQGQIDLTTCVDEFGDFDPDSCADTTYEEIKLVLSTLSAHAFNFFTYDLASGDYRITVEANPETGTSNITTDSSAEATALVGLGTIVVDEVRFGSIPN